MENFAEYLPFLMYVKIIVIFIPAIAGEKEQEFSVDLIVVLLTCAIQHFFVFFFREIYRCNYTFPENVLFSPRPTTHLEALP